MCISSVFLTVEIITEGMMYSWFGFACISSVFPQYFPSISEGIISAWFGFCVYFYPTENLRSQIVRGGVAVWLQSLGECWGEFGEDFAGNQGQ